MLEKTPENPLDCKEIQPVHPKGNQSWIVIRRTDAEAETSTFWPPDVKNWLIGKDHNAGQDWRQEEKGTTEDEMVGWHHWLDGDEFEQTLGFGDRQWSLACCSPWTQMANSQTWLSYWTTVAFLNYLIILLYTYNFPGGSDGKESACNIGNVGFIPGSGRSPGEGNGYPLQYSCLENSMDREA